MTLNEEMYAKKKNTDWKWVKKTFENPVPRMMMSGRLFRSRNNYMFKVETLETLEK